jgi:hypothetical protein
MVGVDGSDLSGDGGVFSSPAEPPSLLPQSAGSSAHHQTTTNSTAEELSSAGGSWERISSTSSTGSAAPVSQLIPYHRGFMYRRALK